MKGHEDWAVELANRKPTIMLLCSLIQGDVQGGGHADKAQEMAHKRRVVELYGRHHAVAKAGGQLLNCRDKPVWVVFVACRLSYQL